MFFGSPVSCSLISSVYCIEVEMEIDHICGVHLQAIWTYLQRPKQSPDHCRMFSLKSMWCILNSFRHATCEVGSILIIEIVCIIMYIYIHECIYVYTCHTHIYVYVYYTHHKDSQHDGVDDDTPYVVFWPWHTWKGPDQESLSLRELILRLSSPPSLRSDTSLMDHGNLSPRRRESATEEVGD